ncbi:MAG: hypothetical protein ACTHJ5_00695 [Ilyomonas sp.]
MKKILLAASLAIASATFAGTTHFNTIHKMEKGDGRHISESEVPSRIVNAFYSRYPGATNVRWEVEKEHGHKVYEVEFMLNGKKKKAEFEV